MSAESEIARARQQVEVEANDEQGNAPEFVEGFSSKTVVGTLFVALIMLPGALYLGLVAGQGLGPAAEWVTIVLFSEIMRRSFLPMKRQEIYILYYIAASLTGLAADKGLSGGPFGGFIWAQYFVQSPQAALVAKSIPHWVVPPAGSPALIHRTFLDKAWLEPILLMVAGQVRGRLMWISAGYFLFRVTSDVEQLPFPMAPVAASGATALADAASKEESWRWSIFSIGTIIGLLFGFLYIAIPVFTGVVFGHAFQLLPIPFLDTTTNTQSILPGAITGINPNIGNALVGFVIPYPIVAGSLWGCFLFRVFGAPFFYHLGLFGNSTSNGWTPGMNGIYTKQVTDIKFWLSITIGLQIAVAIIGLASVVSVLRAEKNARRNRGMKLTLPKGRGDVPIWLPIAIWASVTVFYMLLCEHLISSDKTNGIPHTFPVWLLIFYGVVWSPINSYVSARMNALTGSTVSVPFLQQISIMESGYTHVDAWYAPIPLNDFGYLAQRFRELELTGTKFVSLIKAEALMFVIVLPASFVFWAFFWHTNQIPSSQFPFANKMWPIAATFEAMFDKINAKSGGMQWVHLAINFPRIGLGIASGLLTYGLFSLLRIPVLFYYGFVGGVGANPPDVLMTFLGAWLSKHYFEKRFGIDNWRKYTPVLLAGFSCGTGLIAMASIALALIAKSVNYLPF